ncbi:unnamed protein product [Hymenolepis diminuta]|uniref:Uncharacterized protein n=1 Tax=Hymenolepis diminuta TaxID=6216 RepID=A0A564YT70_HYMDI|nr:unnamed protein product [Hymenolepis diminuta]
MESSMSVSFISEPTVLEQQSVPNSHLRDYQTNQICHLKGQKGDCCTFTSTRTNTSATNIKSPKLIGQCNHIRPIPMLVCHPIRSALVHNKCRQPEKIGRAKPESLVIGTVSKVVAQNTSEAALSHH